MGISYKPSNSELPNPVTASGNMLVSGNLVVNGTLSAGGISGSGEANTASNVGGGTGVFKQKTGVDLEFKSLVGSGITINSKTSTIELTASGGGSTNPGGSDTQVQFNQNGSFAGDSGFTYDGSGSVSFGSAASDTHQVTGTLAISGTQPATFYGPEGTGGSAAIIAAHTSSIDDWQSPISGALVVSADIGLGGTGNRGAAVLYVHSQGTESRLGFKNSSTLVSVEQKNQVTAANAGGAYVGLTSTQLDVRNEIGDVLIQADASGEILVSGDGTRIGNNANDFHKISGSLNISGSQTGLLHVRGDVTASNVMPQADLTYDLGSTTLQWNNIYANELIGDVEGAIRFNAINSEGAAISKGQVVHINGISGQTPTVGLAACDDASKMPAFGLAAADAANSASVQIVTFGSLQNINLTAVYGKTFSVGDVIFVETGSNGTSGSLTNIAPTGSNNLLQNMGKVVRNGGGGDGQIKVGGAGRTNATPNLDEGYLFVGNGSDQSVQDNTVFISSSANLVGINNTNPDHTLTVTGDISASVNVSASAFYGDGSNLENLPAGSAAGSNTQIQFNQNGSFAGNDKLTYNGTGSLFVSASITASAFQANFTNNPTASIQNMTFDVITASLNSAPDTGGKFVFTLPDGDTPSDNAFIIRQFDTTEVLNVDPNGFTFGGDLGASGRQLRIGDVIAETSIVGDDAGLSLQAGDDTQHVLFDEMDTSEVRFRDKSQNVLGAIASSSLGGVSFDYHTGSISNVAMVQNTYYSASISSDTSVPTNQYNFINYQLGASLALTASSPVAGASYIILLRQDGTGGRVVSFDSATFKFPSGSSTTNSTGSNDVDIVTGISDGSVIYAAMSKKFE